MMSSSQFIKKTAILTSIIILIIADCAAQKKFSLNPFVKQNSDVVDSQKFWMHVEYGLMNFATHPGGLDFMPFNPSISGVYTTKNYRLLKIKSSFSTGISFLETIYYPQYIYELALMTGKIKRLSPRIFFHYYFGVAFVGGRKQESLIFTNKGNTGSGGGMLSLGPIFPTTEYKMKQFATVGIPFEIMFSTNRMGYGIYGCLNSQLSG